MIFIFLDHGKMVEELVIDLIHFLHPLYLVSIIALFVTIVRCIFYKENQTSKVAVSFKSGDGIIRQILHLDTQLLKAADITVTFALFYMLPPWLSCFMYFIIYKLCLRVALRILTPGNVSTKSKVE